MAGMPGFGSESCTQKLGLFETLSRQTVKYCYGVLIGFLVVLVQNDRCLTSLQGALCLTGEHIFLERICVKVCHICNRTNDGVPISTAHKNSVIRT